MKFTEQKFDLMLESAWRGFESTLMLHGMSKQEVINFMTKVVNYNIYTYTGDALSEAVEWEGI